MLVTKYIYKTQMNSGNYYTFDMDFQDNHIQKGYHFSGTKFRNIAGQSEKLERLMKRNLAVQESNQFIEKLKSLAMSTLNTNRSKTEMKKSKNLSQSVQIPKINYQNISLRPQFKAVITNKNKYPYRQNTSDFQLPSQYINFRGNFGKTNGTILTRFKGQKPGNLKYLYKNNQSIEQPINIRQKQIKVDNFCSIKQQKSLKRLKRRSKQFQSLLAGERKNLFFKQVKASKREFYKLSQIRARMIDKPFQVFDNPQYSSIEVGQNKYDQYLNSRYQDVCPWRIEDEQNGNQNQH